MAILKGIISKLNGSAGNLTFKQLGGKTVVPGLVTVIAGLLLLLLLLFYIIAYYITPIRRMMDSMEDYIRRGRRYSYEFDGDDELHRLNRDISEIAQENVELRKRIKLLRDQIQGEDR